MSEPDSAPPRQPPTIDLKAEEVGGQGSPGRAKSYAIGIAIGAAAVAFNDVSAVRQATRSSGTFVMRSMRYGTTR